VPVAHTDGDTMGLFPSANVIMTGDFYRSTGYRTSTAPTAHDERLCSPASTHVRAGRPDTGFSGTARRRQTAVRRAQGDDDGGARQGRGPVRQNKTQEEVIAERTAEFDARSRRDGRRPDRFVGSSIRS